MHTDALAQSRGGRNLEVKAISVCSREEQGLMLLLLFSF